MPEVLHQTETVGGECIVKKKANIDFLDLKIFFSAIAMCNSCVYQKEARSHLSVARSVVNLPLSTISRVCAYLHVCTPRVHRCTHIMPKNKHICKLIEAGENLLGSFSFVLLSSSSISNKNKEVFILAHTAPVPQNCNYFGHIWRIPLVSINFSHC